MADIRDLADFTIGYRSTFWFNLEKNETVDEVTENLVHHWLKNRKDGIDRTDLDQWNGRQSHQLPSGTRIEFTPNETDPSDRVMLRYRTTDAADDGTYQVTVSAVSAPHKKRAVAILIEAGRTQVPDQETLSNFKPPRLVHSILGQKEVFNGTTPLLESPHIIRLDDVDQLITAIRDEERQVSLFVASSLDHKVDSRWREIIGGLTEDAAGTAATYVVTSEAVDTLNSQLPAELQVEAGHLRMIAPKVNFEQPVQRRHPLWTPEQITGMLDAEGQPTEQGRTEIAAQPRRLLLDVSLPARLRRRIEVLDQRERRGQLEREVQALEEAETRESELAATTIAADPAGETPDAPSTLETAEDPRAHQLPTRREHHGRTDSSDDSFWDSFRRLLAHWLGKNPQEISEENVDAHLMDLDRQINKDRHALEVQEQFLTNTENTRNELRVEISDLKEQLEEVGVSRDAHVKTIAELERMNSELQNQLREATGSVGSAETVATDNTPQLVALTDKLAATRSVRDHIDNALLLMAQRLNPILQDGLNAHLQGLSWVALLKELDHQRGRIPADYSETDPAAQLRMLTERLGNLGHPFERDQNREVSTRAQSLRILRNRWAHNDNFESRDAERAYDDVYMLLLALDDNDGAEVAKEARDSLPPYRHSPHLPAPSIPADESVLLEDDDPISYPDEESEESLAEAIVDSSEESPVAAPEVEPEPEAIPEAEAADVPEDEPVTETPAAPAWAWSPPRVFDDFSSAVAPNDAETLQLIEDDAEAEEGPPVAPPENVLRGTLDPNVPQTLAGNTRPVFEEWQITAVEDREHLNSLRRPSSATLVRTVIEEIVNVEGPILLERLIRLTARQFGMSSARGPRHSSLHRQVIGTGLLVDDDKFVWPRHIDRETWEGFRPQNDQAEKARVLPEISPVEVRNAAKFIVEDEPEIDRVSLEQQVLQTFGLKARTAAARRYLAKAMDGVPNIPEDLDPEG